MASLGAEEPGARRWFMNALVHHGAVVASRLSNPVGSCKPLRPGIREKATGVQGKPSPT